ncbi:DNA polymerase epsilon subunit 3 [Culicoides brevitarsis]|uniref:DNA polymerase epsilon subunit 3 n=1 Tax=Culicoides brevitarsis TaxID=469753 RepID=UPI00307B9A8E
MVERIEDLNLPNAVVTRLMKEALPDGISISKEARSALTRAASVYILYLTTAASTAAKDKNLKTLNANHVFEALEEIEFENYVDPLKAFLETYRSSQKEKRESKGTPAVKSPSKKDSSKETNDDEVQLVDE